MKSEDIMTTNCDMCGTEIKDGKCQCGEWSSVEEMKDHPIKKGLEYFHELKQFVVSSDVPHLGCAVVYFRGTYKDCELVKKFIYKMNGREFYDQRNQ